MAKRVFQLYWVEPQSGEVHNRRFTRSQLLEFLGTRVPGKVAMEACGSAHWWARKLQALGHEPVLLHAQTVRGFVRSNKTDAADARAIWSAACQPEARRVPLKSQRLQPLPQSFVDVNMLRTDLQHDVDHGDEGKIKAKQRKLGEAFLKYSGTKTPQLLDAERFVLVQANLLSAIELDLRNLAIS